MFQVLVLVSFCDFFCVLWFFAPGFVLFYLFLGFFLVLVFGSLFLRFIDIIKAYIYVL